MKSLLVLIIFVNSLLAYNYNLTPKRVNATTFCFFGAPEAMDTHNNGNMVNSCYVDMGSSYLVIDSGPTYIYAKDAYTAMKKIADKPISYVVNTHSHDDHWLGNSYFSELGVKIIGSKEFKNEVPLEMTRMQRRILKEAYVGTKQIFPKLYVNHEKTLVLDGKKVLLKDVNKKAHSKSDLFVYIPAYNTIFAGDLVFNQRIPSIRDGNPNNWIEALDEIRAINAQYVIGGHGDLIDKHSIDATYRYLSELVKQVSECLDYGDDITDCLNKVVMSDFKNFKMYDSLHRQNVEVAYRILEWEQ